MQEKPTKARTSPVRLAAAVATSATMWPIALGLGFLILRASWPAYVAAQPEKAYTLAMLFCRLIIYSSTIAATSATAALVARDERLAWFAGAVILAISIPPHLYPGHVWDDYPVWYHLLYLTSVIPISWIAGRLVRPIFTTADLERA